MTLGDHRRVAGDIVDAAIRAASRNYVADLRQLPEVATLLRASAPDRSRSIAVVLVERTIKGSGMAARIGSLFSSGGWETAWTAGRILGLVAPKPIPFSRDDAAMLLELVSSAAGRRAGGADEFEVGPVLSVTVGAAERAVKLGGLKELESPVRQLTEALDRFGYYDELKTARYRARLVALLQSGGVEIDPWLINEGDAWGRMVRPVILSADPSLAPFLTHLPTGDGVVPPAKWRSRLRELLVLEGAKEMTRELVAAAIAAPKAAPPRVIQIEARTITEDDSGIQSRNALVLRGALWAAGELREPWVAGLLGEIGIYYGTSGFGNIARDERIANTAAAVLATLDDEAAFTALGRMKAKVTNRNVTKQVAKALDTAAARNGVSASELLELAVPTLGLDADRRCQESDGDWTAIIEVDPGAVTNLTWRGPDGRETTRPPKTLADSEPAFVRRAKGLEKEIQKGLVLERGRVEDLLAEEREWPIAVWRARYLQHPVTSVFARRLVWIFIDGPAAVPGIALTDEPVGVDGESVPLSDDARVRLWHPIHATDEAIAAWRSYLVERRVRQPFKQAFREVYRLTPAEEDTVIYSNRFAGHILAYGQARALMTARRWGSNFLGSFDGGDTGVAKREFRSYGLQAEFYHDAIYDDEDQWATEVRHCSTDQVRFVPMGRRDAEPVRLVEVPPIVFSEAMRDVDLFVGVSSVAADTNWQDTGLRRDVAFRQYFDAYWDGELGGSARVRRDAIERMLPGLTIADRCKLLDRYLEVRGDKRTYKIHLGSGNILMEPADTYLCIVPARGGRTAGGAFLPFDDDPMLSLILSKAFLLADDKAITDRTILQQIGR